MEKAKILEGKEGPGDVQVFYCVLCMLLLVAETVECFRYEYSHLFASFILS